MEVNQKTIKEAGMTLLEFSKALGISYSNLGNKLNGFCGWVDDELERGRAILAEAKAQNEKAA
jgi:predicted transcriptional regulator